MFNKKSLLVLKFGSLACWGCWVYQSQGHVGLWGVLGVGPFTVTCSAWPWWGGATTVSWQRASGSIGSGVIFVNQVHQLLNWVSFGLGWVHLLSPAVLGAPQGLGHVR